MFSGFCELVMETLQVVVPVRPVVLSSVSWDGLLRCLKYAVGQLLDSGVDDIAVVRMNFSAENVGQVLELGPVCLFVDPAGSFFGEVVWFVSVICSRIGRW